MQIQHRLSAKQNSVKFVFNNDTSSYHATLTLLNQSQQPLYFRIVSTFGKLLSFENQPIKKVEPSKSVIHRLKVKVPNQIKKHEQKLLISYSKCEISSKVNYFDDPSFSIDIEFEQNIPDEDQAICDILTFDCEQLCDGASELIKTGFVKKALHKYEQAFMLYRQHGKGLYGMAECMFLMQSWNKAIDFIQTALLISNNETYLWLKLKIVFEIYKDEPRSLKMIKALKKQILSLTNISNNCQKKKQMLEYLSKEEDKIIHEKGGKLMTEFIDTALAKYETDPYLKTLYKDFSHYEREVLDVLGMRKPHTMEQTPDFVLDPINYQIMNNPFIVPYGHSYEQSSILSYLTKHGNKDLFTRQELRYEWTRPNNALRNYIKNNPHLNQWVSYEKEITSFK